MRVVGADSHRRLCRHEGVAYVETFGPPLIFTTPNPADTQQPLFLIVQGQEVRLDARGEYQEELPKYRDMMRRVAQDPVSQTVMFELLIRLFLQVVLNVRPETLACRRQSSRTSAREWCTDGVAAASSGAGMLGPVLAFRGEVEAQGRLVAPSHPGMAGVQAFASHQLGAFSPGAPARRAAAQAARVHAPGCRKL